MVPDRHEASELHDQARQISPDQSNAKEVKFLYESIDGRLTDKPKVITSPRHETPQEALVIVQSVLPQTGPSLVPLTVTVGDLEVVIESHLEANDQATATLKPVELPQQTEVNRMRAALIKKFKPIAAM